MIANFKTLISNMAMAIPIFFISAWLACAVPGYKLNSARIPCSIGTSLLFKAMGFAILLLLLPLLVRSNNDQPNIDSLKQVLADARGIDAANTLKALIDVTWNSEREAAFEYIEQLDELAKQLSIDSISAYATYRKAIVTYLDGDYQRAADEFAGAAKLYLNSNQQGDALQASAREGVMYSLMGNNDKAAAIYSAALQKAEKYGKKEAEAYLLSQLATVYHYKGVKDSAELYYQASIEKYDALQDSSGLMRSMNNLLILRRENYDLPGTLEVIQSIYDFHLRNQRFDNAAFTLCSKGDALHNMRRSNESFDAYSEAFELAQKNGHKRAMHSALLGMATIEIDRDNPLNARSYLTEAFGYFSGEADDANGTANILTDLGYTYLMTEQYDSAAYYYNNALALADSLQFERYRDLALVGLGEARLKQGKIKEVKAISRRLADLSESFASPKLLYSYYALEGALRLDLKDYSGAIPFLSDAYNYNMETGRPVIALEKAMYLLEAYKEVGQTAQALEYAEIINRLKDTLNKSQDLERLAEQRKDFEFQLERQKLEVEKAKEEAILKARATQNMIIALGGLALAALGFGFFWNTRRRNRTIARQNDQLQRLNETKDRLFAIIGHDLRKPAIAFRGITKKVNYLLRKKDFRTLEQLGEEIEQDAAGLSQLTENLLNWALTQRDVMPYQPTQVKLLPLLEDTAAPFQTALQNKHLDLEWAIHDDTIVFSDANALSTIVRNLLDNAIKFTPEGGRITIEGTTDDGLFRLKVRDTGVGIPPEKLKELFLLKEGRTEAGTAGEKGAGLGLHLAQELSKLNQSTLGVSSRIGKGTIFTLSLPLKAT